MSKTIKISLDPLTKEKVERLYQSLGVDISTAVRMFFKASLEANGIPFPIRLKPENTGSSFGRDDSGADRPPLPKADGGRQDDMESDGALYEPLRRAAEAGVASLDD
jgi:addiction module RelB/DinJ family antitoxin